MDVINLINIVPGFWCNLTCDHCVNDSGPTKKKSGLRFDEVENLIHQLNELKPINIVFTGGEPLLYLESIKAILERLNYEFETSITTNGFFARNAEETSLNLDQIKNLKSVQLSFDLFHRDKLTSVKPIHLKNYCNTKHINFNISVSISNPLDLVFAAEVEEKFQVPVIFQKVEASGRGKTKKTEFTYPIFDNSVLDSVCPNNSTVSFIPNKGFTPCCSNLVFNQNDLNVSWATITEMKNDPFYKELVKVSLRDRAIKKGINILELPPEMSSACRLCEHISMMNYEKKVQ